MFTQQLDSLIKSIEELSKAKDELFPDYSKAVPVASNCEPTKESAANAVLWAVNTIKDIQDKAWLVADKYPDAKEAFEHLFENAKKDLRKRIAEFKKAKPMEKSISYLDALDEELAKMSPVVAGAITGAITGGVKGAIGAKVAKEKTEKAADGAPKPPRTLDYSQMKKPKAPEADAPTINYSHTAAPTRTAGTASAEAGFKIPKEKKKPLADPKFRSKLAEQRRASGFTKSEDFGKITETLTKSIRSRHSDGEISEMLKAAVDSNQIHRNVLIEWINYRTINPAVMSLVEYEDEA